MSYPEKEVQPKDYKRLRRYDTPGQARALNFACFRNQRFLTSDRAKLWFAQAVAKFLPEFQTDLWAYCVMPTHAHLLVFPRGAPQIAKLLASIKKSVTVRAVRYLERNAPHFLPRMTDLQPNGQAVRRFWQRGGGFDRNLRASRGLWNVIDYIHRNPVSEGLAARPELWTWSSAPWYLEQRPGPMPLQLEKLPPRRWTGR